MAPDPEDPGAPLGEGVLGEGVLGPEPDAGEAETITIDKWFHPASEPRNSLAHHVRRGAMVAALAGAILTPISYPGPATGFVAGSIGGPTFSKTVLYQVRAYVPVTAAPPEVVTLDKHWQGVSQPTRRVVERQGQQPSFEVFPRPFTVQWLQPLSEPTRRVVERQAPLPSFEVFPRPFTTQWLQPLSEPTRRVVERQWQQASFYPTPIAGGTPGNSTGFVTGSIGGPTFSKVTLYQSLASVYFQPAAEVVTSDKWFAAPSQPTLRNGLQTQLQRQPVLNPFPRPFTVEWLQPTSQPTTRVVERQAPLPSFNAFPRPFTIEWHRPFSEPTRRGGLKTQLNPQPFYGSYVPITVTLTHGWFSPFSEPTRRVVERIAPQPFFYPFPYPPVAGAGNEHNWFTEQNQPTRRKGLEVQLQPQPFYGSFVPLTVTLEYGWFRPLSEPTLRVVERQAPLAIFSPYPRPAVADFGWFRPLAEPARGIVTRQGPLPSFDPYPIPPVVAVDYGWFVPFSEPVRAKGPLAAHQQGAFLHPRPTVPFGWFRALDEPTRRKLLRLQQYSFHPTPVISLGWMPLPNTPPARLVFPTRQQQYLAHIPRVAAGPGVRYDWFVPLETPVRVRLRLGTGSQQYLAYYPLPLPIDLSDVPICRFYLVPVRQNIYLVPDREDFEVAQRDNTAEPTRDDPLEVGTRNNITGVKC